MDRLRVILRVAFSFPVMPAARNVLAVVRLAERNLPHVDIWWHPRNAQHLFTHHQLPNMPRLLSESWRVHTLADPVRVLHKCQIRYELYPFQQPLSYALKTSPDCKVLYTGQITALFERVGPMPAGPGTRQAN